MARIFLIFFASFLSMATPLVSSAPSPNPCIFSETESKKPAKTFSNLAMKLYQQLSKPQENIVFSPASIALALAAVENGANDVTHDEIESVIGIGEPVTDSTRAYQSVAMKLFGEKDSNLKSIGDNPTLKMANGLFFSDKIRMEPYFTAAAKCFGAEVIQEPVGSQVEEARGRINQWVLNATENKISELFKSGSIDENTVGALASALALDVTWDRWTSTVKLPFYRSGKSDQGQEVPFIVKAPNTYVMTSTDTFGTVEIDSIGDTPFNLLIILPKKRDGIADVEKSLTGEKLKAILDEYDVKEREDVRVKIPKFAKQYSMDLKDVLVKLGVSKMFSDGANFGRMGNDSVKISGAQHGAYFRIGGGGKEQESKPTTTKAPNDNGKNRNRFFGIFRPRPIVDFVADHPFIYAIVHPSTKAILFMGKVDSVGNEA